jgi:uncharacterized protein YbbC (DUF1343 family)
MSVAVVRAPGRARAEGRILVGLERVAAQGVGGLRGRRVGLLAHAASVDHDGRHAIDVLRGAGVGVVRLFGPEHGLRGQAAAGESIESGVDRRSGLPVVSLYGSRTAPAPTELDGLDMLVVDLQDVGVRFYTYVSTVLLCLEPAAAVGLEVVVLDRPNPLGGVRMAGPMRDPAQPFRLVSVAPGPLVHGLTLGEMTLLANRRRDAPARVRVVPLQGWERSMTWPDTGREWVSPSPNLRSAAAALVYPGTCLLEGTNVSEGRGTEAPFLMFGAPWMRAVDVAREAASPGLDLEPCRFTPTSSPAAPQPKLAGVSCQGLRVRMSDPGAVRAYAFGLRLLAVLRRLHPEFGWLAEGSVLDGLLGTGSVRAALDRGEPVEEILARDEPGIERFARERQQSLLY